MKLGSKLAWCAVLATASTACTVVPPRSLDVHYVGQEMIYTERQHIDRYACLSGAPLDCKCTSMRLGYCDCRCNY